MPENLAQSGGLLCLCVAVCRTQARKWNTALILLTEICIAQGSLPSGILSNPVNHMSVAFIKLWEYPGKGWWRSWHSAMLLRAQLSSLRQASRAH